MHQKPRLCTSGGGSCTNCVSGTDALVVPLLSGRNGWNYVASWETVGFPVLGAPFLSPIRDFSQPARLRLTGTK
jgi:hypothetical protein